MIVSQTIQKVTINAFIGCRMYEKAHLLETKEEFCTLDHFCEALNSVESLADVVYVVSRYLLVHADNLANEANTTGTEAEEASLEAYEINALGRAASVRRKKRILFLNGPNYVRLRTQVRDHFILTCSTPKYCTLCGNDSGPLATWREHRTRRKCSKCCVHCCVTVHAGIQKGCWDVCHSIKVLAKRHTPAPFRNAAQIDIDTSQNVPLAMERDNDEREALELSLGNDTRARAPVIPSRSSDNLTDNPRPLRRSRRSYT